MKEGGDRVGQLVKAECVKNKVAPPFQKCEWNFYFDPSRGLDVVESLVEYMLDKGYIPKTSTGRIEIGDKKYTKSQIVDMYREKDLSEIVKAIKSIQAKMKSKDELEPADA